MKNLVKHIVFILVSLFFLNSCGDQNKTTISISGTVFDPELGIPIEGVTVKLYSQRMENGTWSFNYQEEASLLTGPDGRFDFSLDFNYNPAFRLEFSHNSYFSDDYEILPEDLTDGTTFEKEFEMHPKSTLTIHVKNNFPFDDTDKLRFRVVEWDKQCPECCYTDFYEFTGSDVDQSESCQVIGETTYTIEYISIKNGNQNVSMRQVFCPAFGEGELEIFY